MTRLDLLRRTLRHDRWPHLAVLLGVAAATATIAGALIVGDSVRGSLRQMTLDRLGDVDAAVTGQRFFREELAEEISGDGVTAAPAILLEGTLKVGSRVAMVDVIGVDARGWSLLSVDGKEPPRDDFSITNFNVLQSVAEATPSFSEGTPRKNRSWLYSFDGDGSLLIELPAAIPRDTLLGERDEQITEVGLQFGTGGDILVFERPQPMWFDLRSSDGAQVRGQGMFEFDQSSVLEYPFLSQDVGASRFSLSPSQESPKVVYVSLDLLQDQLGLAEVKRSRRNPEAKPARVNTLLISTDGGSAVGQALPDTNAERQSNAEGGSRQAEPDLQRRLDAARTLEDLDLRVVADEDGRTLSVESRSMILPNAAEAAAREAADELGVEADGVLVYLVNEARRATASRGRQPRSSTGPESSGEEPRDDVLADQKRNMSSDPNSGADALGSQEREEAIQHSAYFVAAGLPLELAGFEFVGEAPSFPLRDGEVLLNEWLAEGLGVTAGEEVDVGYFPVGSRGEGPEEQVTWRVAGVVKTKGSGADSGLTPSVPGITDADTFADWEQPFEMDLSQVTDRDEEYWDEYRAAPKLFLPLTAMQERFRSRYGAVTSVRVRVPEGEDVDEWKERLSAAVLRKMTPERSGLIVRNVKEEQLAAAAGTTDFSGLFFGFSMFLIASAVLLVALLFRLGVEKRVEQLGLLSAVGFGPKRATRLVLAEGAVVAVLGGLFGLLLAVVYAGVMIHGLKTWWGGAIGTQFLTLHVKPAAMLIGFFASVWMALAAMWFAVRKLRALSPRQLMAGRSEPSLDEAGVRSRGGQARRVAAWSAGVVVLLLVGLMTGLIPDVEAFAGFSVRVVAFFLVGFVALVAAVAGLSATLDQKTGTGAFSLPVLGWRNTARARSRSLLTGGLIASATFVLVAVAVARKDPTGEAPKVDSGNGGYSLVAETSVPILFDLNTEAGRDKAGFNADEAALEGVDLVGLRMKPGDDASCLNLYQARLPTLLGVPDEVLERWSDEGRWKFADTPQAAQWAGLWNGAAADAYRDQSNTFPVVGDMNTLMYSLKKPIGSLIDVPAGAGPSVSDAKLNVIGMLDGSVFQGVLLMRQSDLLTLFPDLPGDRYFLVECPPVQQDAVAAALESGLADYGFDAEPVAARIANFLAVQNTYLSTFKTLGGLGLLLGTFGLATVMLRNVVERRRELALMRAVGYRPRRLGTLVLGETAGLLLYGLAAGTAAALLAMLPHLNSSGADVPWRSLFGLLAAVFVVGMLAALSAVRRAAKTPLLAGLRSE